MPIVIIGMVKNDGTMKEAEERATASLLATLEEANQAVSLQTAGHSNIQDAKNTLWDGLDSWAMSDEHVEVALFELSLSKVQRECGGTKL